MLLKNIILVGLGGMIGSVLRYLTSYFIRHESFPYATFIVNIAGSLLIGAVMGIAARQEGFSNWRLFLATGICGGFTTFSAFAWENMQLLSQERYGSFIWYTGGTLVLGLAAVTAGYWITK
ncbi:MAG: fluoride efflux transporter CrcB [Bacteroidota bacterium]